MPPPLPYLKETPSQTAGPYVHIGLAPSVAGLSGGMGDLGQDIAGPEAPGERITVEGMVLDGTGAPVRDAVIEAWQADAAGIYPHPEDPRHAEAAPSFRGWGRACTDFETGIWTFETVKPGPVPGPDGALQAPHVNLWIVARGINLGLATRLYFSDEGEANRDDPVLGLIDQTHRRDTLMARREDRDGAVVYRFDIHLQGEHETVFLEI